ncbi:hypothetical protein [Clostridium luticellarii]|uniref:Bypass of forespore C C-terminal domain-containing protein n=1 Tax=Clostridium luticellarii TaxID=1691940 RepID=A0A2T0BLL8_9CLOT|nr:hypothetical protein [Clostridium luticellarii]MCI1944301.1 hypothetical protein [Clostridium luticellarii]MCI1967797.1 hypothetical protein [Clostridium luticellarii]MCI1994675.1 hypothetical protein [Clostridium luticellarii]MCI2038828.1 hypothetical protein [Clostridium luticellarii]PRR84775.1 hypothetical protein CLLU_22400 [Clostridium luticellarii]
MDRRKIRTTVLVVFTILIFVLSCYICVVGFQNINMEKNLSQAKKNSNSYDTVKVNSSMNDAVADDARIIFKIKYNKSGEVQVEKQESAGKLAGKKKSEVEKAYKGVGYKIEKFSAGEIILVKDVDKYAPGKYVLGIKDGFIAIYKTDKQGNMFIENKKRDITHISTDRLKAEDIKLLTKGDKYFQCNTREEAEARLEDYE